MDGSERDCKDAQIDANDANWREKMFCAARSTQMATTIPMEANRRKEKKSVGTCGNSNEEAKL